MPPIEVVHVYVDVAATMGTTGHKTAAVCEAFQAVRPQLHGRDVLENDVYSSPVRQTADFVTPSSFPVVDSLVSSKLPRSLPLPIGSSGINHPPPGELSDLQASDAQRPTRR